MLRAHPYVPGALDLRSVTATLREEPWVTPGVEARAQPGLGGVSSGQELAVTPRPPQPHGRLESTPSPFGARGCKACGFCRIKQRLFQPGPSAAKNVECSLASGLPIGGRPSWEDCAPDTVPVRAG